jgi:hypothetical protein
MKGRCWSPLDDGPDFDVPRPEVFEIENPVIGRLFDPDGEVIFEIYERSSVTFGFCRPEEETDDE